MAKHITISPEALAALQRGTFTDPASPATCGFWLFRFAANDGTLPRPVYEAANKALAAAGGKWNRGLKAHLFNCDPRGPLGVTIATGKAENRQQVLQLFETPPAIARKMVERAEVQPGHCLLEPSAGTGRLIEAIMVPRGSVGPKIMAVEKDYGLSAELLEKYSFHAEVLHGDFLEWKTERRFDRIVMNPPFERGSDVKHILHALGLLAPGGRCVALLAAGAANRHAIGEHPWLMTWELLPAKSFKESGTPIDIAMAVLARPC